MSNTETKERILEVAEKLFADDGFAATSLRKITTAAKANLAAVNYHFGSKEALIGAVFARRLRALNEERIANLEQVLRDAGDEPPRLEEILHAFVLPTVRMMTAPGVQSLRRLMMRIHADPKQEEVMNIFVSQFREVMGRFLPVIHSSVPEVSLEDLTWRIRFSISTMIHAMGAPKVFHALWQDHCGPFDHDEMVDRLIDYMAAGIRHTPARAGGGEPS